MCVRRRALHVILLLVVVLMATTGVARAWDYPCSWWGPTGSLYVSDQTPPYFAIHPPVYYSYVVRRPYGYSPFPYPPDVLTPERPPTSPLVVHNQYACVEVAAPTGNSSAAAKPGPLRIQNSFVTSAAQAPAIAPSPPKADEKPAPVTAKPESTPPPFAGSARP
jgi:hypothetical protein